MQAALASGRGTVLSQLPFIIGEFVAHGSSPQFGSLNYRGLARRNATRQGPGWTLTLQKRTSTTRQSPLKPLIMTRSRRFFLLSLSVRLIATTRERWFAGVQILWAAHQSAPMFVAIVAAIEPCNTASWWIENLAGMKSKRLLARLSVWPAFYCAAYPFAAIATELPA